MLLVIEKVFNCIQCVCGRQTQHAEDTENAHDYLASEFCTDEEIMHLIDLFGHSFRSVTVAVERQGHSLSKLKIRYESCTLIFHSDSVVPSVTPDPRMTSVGVVAPPPVL